jgi:flagellar motility protein MotE (MotC chaperone)
MASHLAVAHPCINSLSSFFRNSVQEAGQLAGRVVRYFGSLPAHMRQNGLVASSTFLVANGAFFFAVMNRIANYFEVEVGRNLSPPLSEDQKTVKTFLINSIVVGGSVLTFNVIISKILHYPLCKLALAAITVTAIAARYYLSPKADPKSVIKKPSEEQSRDSIEIAVEANNAQRIEQTQELINLQRENEELNSQLRKTSAQLETVDTNLRQLKEQFENEKKELIEQFEREKQKLIKNVDEANPKGTTEVALLTPISLEPHLIAANTTISS